MQIYTFLSQAPSKVKKVGSAKSKSTTSTLATPSRHHRQSQQISPESTMGTKGQPAGMSKSAPQVKMSSSLMSQNLDATPTTRKLKKGNVKIQDEKNLQDAEDAIDASNNLKSVKSKKKRDKSANDDDEKEQQGGLDDDVDASNNIRRVKSKKKRDKSGNDDPRDGMSLQDGEANVSKNIKRTKSKKRQNKSGNDNDDSGVVGSPNEAGVEEEPDNINIEVLLENDKPTTTDKRSKKLNKKRQGRSRVGTRKASKGTTAERKPSLPDHLKGNIGKGGPADITRDLQGFTDDQAEKAFPKTPPITPVEPETWDDKLERFDKLTSDMPPPSAIISDSNIDRSRGFPSEPNLYTNGKRHDDGAAGNGKSGSTTRTRHNSMDDHILGASPYAGLMKQLNSEKDFSTYIMSRPTHREWKEVGKNEQKKYSFFEHLVAKGNVFDSVEIPACKDDDPKYYVEASTSTLRKHVKDARVSFKTKNMYTGPMKSWYFQGVGEYIWVDGAKYEGEFLHGVMHGKGKMTWPDNTVYEGHFVKGFRSGWGVYTTADGKTYAGNWACGLPHGNGKIWYDSVNSNTNFYDGDWKKGVPNGFGTRVYENGDRYVGEWKDGLPEGQGEMLWREEHEVHRGEWKNGLPSGPATHALSHDPCAAAPVKTSSDEEEEKESSEETLSGLSE